MSTLLAALCLVLTIGTLAIPVHDLFRRRRDLLSWRNLFLIGYAHFCALSTYFAITMGDRLPYQLTPSTTALLIMALSLPLFFVVYLGCDALGRRQRWATRLLPAVQLPQSFIAITICVAALSITSIALAMLEPAGFVGLLIVQFRGGFGATAVGLATYLLLAARFNPASWFVFLATLAASVLVSVTGASGRRFFVAVIFAIPWMWYFVDLRYRPAKSNLLRIGAAAFIGAVIIVAYSGIRHDTRAAARAFDVGVRARQLLNLLQNPTAELEGALGMLYTDTGMNMLFIIDNYPESYPFQPGQGLLFVLSNPIPRFIWPEKPMAFGVTLQEQMDATANLGPGIIGHGWAEAGFLGIIAYACFFGLLTGVVDRALWDRADNPYFVAVMAAATGNVIALPRGDTPLFFLQIAASIISAIAFLYLCRIASAGLMFAGQPLVPPWHRRFPNDGDQEESASIAYAE